MTNDTNNEFLINMYLTEEFHLVREVNKQFQIARLGQMAQSISNLDKFFNEVCETVASVLNINHVKILKLAPDKTFLYLIAGVGW